MCVRNSLSCLSKSSARSNLNFSEIIAQPDERSMFRDSSSVDRMMETVDDLKHQVDIARTVVGSGKTLKPIKIFLKHHSVVKTGVGEWMEGAIFRRKPFQEMIQFMYMIM